MLHCNNFEKLLSHGRLIDLVGETDLPIRKTVENQGGAYIGPLEKAIFSMR